MDQDCAGPGAACNDEATYEWPGGYCLLPCEAGGGCPGDGVCLDGYCYDGCAIDGDCRGGYLCGGFAWEGACVPACHQNGFCGNGGYCGDDGRCAASGGRQGLWTACSRTECEGFCLDDADVATWGLVDFAPTCTQACAYESDCPAGSACVDLGVATLCLPECEDDTVCDLNGGDQCVVFDGAPPVCFWPGA